MHDRRKFHLQQLDPSQIAWSSSLEFSTDGTLLAADSHRSNIVVINISDDLATRVFRGHSAQVRSIEFSRDDSTLVSGGDDRTVRIWDPSTGLCLRTMAGHKYRVSAAGFLPDGNIFSCGWDNVICIWDRRSGVCARKLSIEPWWRRLIQAVIPDCFSTAESAAVDLGSLMLLAYHRVDGRELLVYWDTSDGRAKRVIDLHAVSPHRMIVRSHRSELIFLGSRGIEIWSVPDCTPVATIADAEIIRSAGISPNGNRLVTACQNGSVTIWDLDTRSPLEHCDLGEDVAACAISSRGAVAFSADDGRVFIGSVAD